MDGELRLRAYVSGYELACCALQEGIDRDNLISVLQVMIGAVSQGVR